MNLSETVHHPQKRQNCVSCGTRVFAYATATDAGGQELGWYCTMCANRLRGVTLCALCFRPIIQDGTGGWLHPERTVFAIRHTAAPEVVRQW